MRQGNSISLSHGVLHDCLFIGSQIYVSLNGIARNWNLSYNNIGKEDHKKMLPMILNSKIDEVKYGGLVY